MISRKEARQLLESMTQGASLLRHMRTIELVMEAYAEKLGEDKEEWAIAGLLHDADYEAFPEKHPQLIVEQLRGYTDNGAKPLFTPGTLLAPTISGAFGGNILAPYSFTMTNPNTTGAICYTTNGSDPRPIGGGAPSGALTGVSSISVMLTNSATLRARIYDSAALAWSPLIEPEFVAGVSASAANLYCRASCF